MEAKLSGVGKHLNAEDVDQDQLKVGILVEMEHTENTKVAERIAIDHLYEHPKYYTTLLKSGLVDEKSAIKLAKKIGLIETDDIKESIKNNHNILSFIDWIKKK